MRLIWTVEDEQKLMKFYYFLLTKGVRGHMEIIPPQKEGQEPRGTLWVVDEDDVLLAKQWLDEYLKDPHHPQFQGAHLEGQTIEAVETGKFLDGSDNKKPPSPPPQPQAQPPVFGTLTLLILATCISLFIFALLGSIGNEKNQQPAGFSTKSLYALLLYDYPAKVELSDQLVAKYGALDAKKLKELPEEDLLILEKQSQTKKWQGLYYHLLNATKGWGEGKAFRPWEGWSKEPTFEKLRTGEFWRPFTPSLLHGNLFHIFFNLIWLMVLGSQIEKRLGAFRYLCFVLFTGVFSNTSQYLVSGYPFLGLSGVICGMLGYIWFRQKNAPWEGYQIQQGSLLFIGCFIFILALAEAGAFYLDAVHNIRLSTGVANTAHLSGVMAGAILAKVPFFSAQD